MGCHKIATLIFFKVSISNVALEYHPSLVRTAVRPCSPLMVWSVISSSSSLTQSQCQLQGFPRCNYNQKVSVQKSFCCSSLPIEQGGHGNGLKIKGKVKADNNRSGFHLSCILSSATPACSIPFTCGSEYFY